MKLNTKDIGQLAKLAQRIPRASARAVRKLTDSRPGHKLEGAEFSFWQNRLAICAQLSVALKAELIRRRVGLPAFRCALPLKQQRALLAANDNLTAQKLLQGQSLAAS